MKPLAVLLALAAATVAAIIAIALVVSGSTENGETVTRTVAEVPLPGPTPDPTVDPDQTISPAQKQAESNTARGPDIHEDAKDETPPGVTPADLEHLQGAQPSGLREPKPLGGAELLSCRQHLVRNFSDRAPGTTVSMTVIHYTVSSPGSLDAIRNLFDTPSFAASSHILLEPSGRCELIVPYAKKAWTQGAFNSVADSVEIVCCLTDPSTEWWKAQPIIAKGLLASWIADRAKARGLPPKLVNPVGCTPQAGWTDHLRLECSNTHVDVGQHFPFRLVSRQVRRFYFAGATEVVWQVRAGGKTLHTQRAVKGPPSGYTRTVRWMRNGGATEVRQAEKELGHVSVRKVAIARS